MRTHRRRARRPSLWQETDLCRRTTRSQTLFCRTTGLWPCLPGRPFAHHAHLPSLRAACYVICPGRSHLAWLAGCTGVVATLSRGVCSHLWGLKGKTSSRCVLPRCSIDAPLDVRISLRTPSTVRSTSRPTFLPTYPSFLTSPPPLPPLPYSRREHPRIESPPASQTGHVRPGAGGSGVQRGCMALVLLAMFCARNVCAAGLSLPARQE